MKYLSQEPAWTSEPDLTRQFPREVRHIESLLAEQPLEEQLVIEVEGLTPEWLHVRDSDNFENLVAMLVLAFPEVSWSFVKCKQYKFSSLTAQEKEQWETIREGRVDRSPLFDPSGLRDWVRERTNEASRRRDEVPSPEAELLPIRPKTCAVIEDEIPYAMFHAHTAYRFGCRCDTFTTWSHMHAVFGQSQSHPYWLLLEDMSLSFADRDPQISLLRLRAHVEDGAPQGRSVHCEALSEDNDASGYRIMITSGQAGSMAEAEQDNRAFLGYKARQGNRGIVLHKPTEGMFGLWRDAGILRKRARWDHLSAFSHKVLSPRSGAPCPPCVPDPRAPGYEWPTSREQDTKHGNPGPITLVAACLLRRALEGLDATAGMSDLVRRAVLATDALELVGDRAPATAIDALTLKHRLEVAAECRFSGVAYHLEVAPRLQEIRRDAEFVTRSFSEKGARKACHNARMHIINQIVTILRDNNQFDEEQECMPEARALHLHLWLGRHPWPRWLAFVPHWYLNTLLRSLETLLLCVFGWVVIFAALFVYITPEHLPQRGLGMWSEGVIAAASSMISCGLPVNATALGGRIFELLTVAAMACGLLHFGVLISHIYSKIARK